MAFNIQTFKSNVAASGFIQTNKYEVIIAVPKILEGTLIGTTSNKNNTSAVVNQLIYRTDSVIIPGITLSPFLVNRYGVGTTQQVPVTAQFQDISLTILLDAKGLVWQFWHNWVKSIFDFTGDSFSQSGKINRFANYSSSYKDNYSTIMQIKVYNNIDSKNAVQTIDIYDAFPVAIRAIPVSWADNNNLMKLNVQIAYKEYTLFDSTPTSQK